MVKETELIKDFPTIWDMYNQPYCAYTGDREDWKVVYSRTRDSCMVQLSNWVFLRGMYPNLEVEAYNHFAYGWGEYLVCDPTDQKTLDEIMILHEELVQYSLWNDELYSNLEYMDNCEHLALGCFTESMSDYCYKNEDFEYGGKFFQFDKNTGDYIITDEMEEHFRMEYLFYYNKYKEYIQ